MVVYWNNVFATFVIIQVKFKVFMKSKTVTYWAGIDAQALKVTPHTNGTPHGQNQLFH